MTDSRRLRVLLSNDDGIRAPGIQALHGAITGTGEGVDGALWGSELELQTIAPLTVQSATSHGITYNTPLMVTEERVSDVMSGIAVDGRPADCVKLGLSTLWPSRFGEGSLPDVVISGMNAGANAGINVIYSGTVAAALEAAFLGVPSIAVSLHLGRGKHDFVRGAAIARRVIDRILDVGFGDGGLLQEHTCVNVNIPICDDTTEPATPAEPEMVVCPINIHGLNDRYERRESPGGDVYYWASGQGMDFKSHEPGTDVDLLFQRKVTITPIMYDLTRYDTVDAWSSALGCPAAVRSRWVG